MSHNGLNNRGFTLIELLAVLVILSLIIVLALPAFNTSMEKSKRDQEEAYKARVVAAAEIYMSDYKYKVDVSECYIRTVKLIQDGYLSSSNQPNDKDGVFYQREEQSFEYVDNVGDLLCVSEEEEDV